MGSMNHGNNSSRDRLNTVVWVVMACLLLAGLRLSAARAEKQAPRAAAHTYQLYIPISQAPLRRFLPLFGGPAPGQQLSATEGRAQSVLQQSTMLAPPCYVTRQGENLMLDGQPYTFVGTNVSYLAGPFFPEDKTEEIISFLAGTGVQVIRVWVEPWCDLDRVERMLDLGQRYNVRFILTLQDFYGHQDGYWFKTKYKTRDLPHIRSIVPRFANRPEVLMWELMNEPTCPAPDANRVCWEALFQWARVTSQEVKRLDPHHLVSAGMQRAGFDERAINTFRDIHALDTIDVVGVHAQGGKVAKGERQLERDMAHELGKPIYFGEVAIRGHDEGCKPLPDGALQKRARAIAEDLKATRQTGLDGYLLWQFAYGSVDVGGGHIQHYCGVFDYFPHDPVWDVIKALQ
jgi:hypothetical protein